MSAGLSSIVYADEADVLKIAGFATFFFGREPRLVLFRSVAG